MNPILIREWKTFFRGKGPYYFLVFYALLHLLIFSGVALPLLQGGGSFEFMLEKAGKKLAGRLFGLQFLIILALSPFLSVKIMTKEREGGIGDLLKIVPYGYWKIIHWKFLASFLIWVLLILMILPLFLFSFNFGDVSLMESGMLFGTLSLLAFFCGVTGLFWTLVFHQPNYSLAAAYFSVFSLIGLLSFYTYPSFFVFRFLSFSL